MSWVSEPQSWVALATLLALEIVLGIDNIIFLSILASKLPPAQQARARTIGLALAMLMRVLLLFSLSWMVQLTQPLFSLLGRGFSGRDAILILGGLFLLTKSTMEIHQKLEGEEGAVTARATASFGSILVQVVLLDIVFSLDSVITAVGMSNNMGIMVTAVVAAVLFMMVFAPAVSVFVERHPTVKMLALSFLFLVGALLIADGWGQHIPRGYVYFAMAFSVAVEMLNLKLRRTPVTEPVKLHEPIT
jgi:predicted tellurium resistance membrane protein TerC